jgi:hypothetical protein
MSSITSGLTSRFYSAAANMQATAQPVQSSQSVSKPSTAMTDIYIPGTEGKVYESFTEYRPSESGGRWDINNNGSFAFKPGYTAVTFIPTPGGFNSNASSNILQNLQSKFPSVITPTISTKTDPAPFSKTDNGYLLKILLKTKQKITNQQTT